MEECMKIILKQFWRNTWINPGLISKAIPPEGVPQTTPGDIPAVYPG